MNSLRKVIMSKKVAREYLKKVSRESSTLTVYFSDERVLASFLDDVNARFGGKISHSRGFDYVTFLSQDKSVISKVSSKAQDKGLDTSGF